MIKTKNIYYAAYLFTASGIKYAGCELILDIGQKTGVLFSFEGDSSSDERLIQRSYEGEQATVNIRKYLDELMFVRDIMYHEISKGKLKDKNEGLKNENRTRPDKRKYSSTL